MKSAAPSKRIYFQVWSALMGLLLLTWLFAQLDLGRWNLAAALLIAVGKMTLIALFFMHLRYSAGLTRVFAAAGLFWFLLMLLLTLGDYLTR